jgi:hypothetical protein
MWLYRYMYKGPRMATVKPQTTPTYRYAHLFLRSSSFENISYLSFLVYHFRCPTPLYLNPNSHLGRFHQSPLSVTAFPQSASPLCHRLHISRRFLFYIINMPKNDKAHTSHRNSVSTASAAGGGTRSSSWSSKDDQILMQARAQGLNWNQISPKHFPSKTANACRKRHERLMERQNAEQWDGGVKLEVLSQIYMEVRREMWIILAARVNEKWQLVEQKVSLRSLIVLIVC